MRIAATADLHFSPQRYAVLRVRQLDELGLDDGQREAILVTNPRRLLAA